MKKTQKTILEEIRGTVDEIIGQIKKIIKEGNARRVLIKNKNGKTIFQSQLTLGAAGLTLLAVYAPLITAVTTILLFANDAKVFIEREVDEDDEKDEYEVEAEVIEITDEEEEKEETNSTKSKSNKDDKDSKSDK